MADTPVVWMPRASETGLPVDSVHVLASPFTGTGALNAVQWQIAATADTGFAAVPLPYDSGLRAPNNRWLGAQAAELPVALAAGTYRVRVRRRGDVLEAWATAVVFTIGTGLTSEAARRAA